MIESPSIRKATLDDLASINAFAAAEGMGAVEATDDVYAAVNDSDEPVGFIRLVFDDAGVCHINPVVVCETWRGYGVGRLLVEYVLKQHGEVRLVSRGVSLAFYEALGFEPIPWETIHSAIVAECDECDWYDECIPVPLSKRA